MHEFFHAPADEYLCIFTANASAALRLVGESYPFGQGGTFALTFDNHNSVNGIREFARRRGARIEYVPVVAPDLRLDRPAMLGGARLRRPDGRRNLLAFPAQSNFSGVQHPLELVDEAHGRWLGRAASTPPRSCRPTASTSLRRGADFVSLSFYKIFGFPTGVGCLLMRRALLPEMRRPWFAGGTITIASVQGDGHYLHPDEAAFEDGTVDYLNLPAVVTGLEHIERLGPRRHPRPRGRPDGVAAALAHRLRHADGSPVVHVLGPAGSEARGGTVTFVDARPPRPSGRRPAGRGAGEPRRHLAAHRLLLQPRRGRGGAPARRRADAPLVRPRAAGVVPRAARPACSLELDLLVAAIRISVGVATTFADVFRFMCFVQGFVDRSVEEIGRVEFVSDNCRIVRDSA